MMEDEEFDRLLRENGSPDINRKQSEVPDGESECSGRRALLCAALDEYELTPTERATAVRVVLGESNPLIAKCRGVSVHTVKAQVRGIFRAADVADRVELGADVLKRVLRVADER